MVLEKRSLRKVLNPVKLVIVIFLFGVLMGCLWFEANSNRGTATTVILIRHAERDNFFVLTAQGRKHAKALADAAGDMGITAIYSLDHTVKPLADHLGTDITQTPRIRKSTVDRIIDDMLADHAREVVLLVGNGSGNLRVLHQLLGGTGEGPHAYGDLYIYTIPTEGPVEVIKPKYGS